MESWELELMYSPNYTVHRAVISAMSVPKELYAASSKIDQEMPAFYAPSYKTNLINVYESLIRNFKSINERIELSDSSPLRSEIYIVMKIFNAVFPSNPVSHRELIDGRA